MNHLLALATTAALILLPLVPAAILYLLLSPKRGRDQDVAEGQVTLPAWLGGMKLQFNVVGSSATYVVILVVAILVFDKNYNDKLRQEAMRDATAWLVEVPVKLETANKQHLPANNQELQQVRVELEPRFSRASAKSVRFWVVPDDGEFPTARFVYPRVGLRAKTLDLNDVTEVDHDHSSRRMEAIGPVWIPVGQTYQ